jgi:FkbM family methyltransferase
MRFQTVGRKFVRSSLPKNVQLWIQRKYLAHEIAHGRRRHSEMDYFSPLVRPGDTVFDVGANAGEYVFELSRLVGPTGKVFAFEPVAYNFSMLMATINKARLQNVEPMNLALSDRTGSRTMVIPDSSTGHHSLAKFAVEWESGREETVQAETLDNLLATGRVTSPTFVKCDVEGSAGEVIRGAVGLIRDHKPAWLVEIWYQHEFEVMLDLGYRAFACSSPLAPATHFDSEVATDYFFLPEHLVGLFSHIISASG